MNIEVNFDFVDEKDLVNFKANRKKVKLIDKMIKDYSGLGNDYLGWTTYPNEIDDTLLDDIQSKADEFRNKYDCLAVCGIGGSYLGAKAVIEAINGELSNDKMEIIFLGNTLDPNYIYQVLEHLKNKNFACCVISKSGTTTETSVSFRLVKNLLKEKYGKDFASRIVAVTDATKGALKNEANKEGYKTFILPGNIGGRFSVMTPVGLFPIACANINIKEFIFGMKEAIKDFSEPDVLKNPCYQYALERNYLYSKKKYSCELLNAYEPGLHGIAQWWKQLFGESEGKDGKGLLPDSSTFTTDLHSLGQFIQEGSKCLFETILYVKTPRREVIVPYDEENLDGLNYLAGKSLSYINHKAYIGTLQAHYQVGKVPNITISMEKFDAFNLGYLLYFFMRACAMSAYLMGVNPFNQPGVEVYKKNMFHLLGKEGY